MNEQTIRDMPVMEIGHNKLVLFHPFVPKSAGRAVAEVLKGRWIGQGPRVDEFEEVWEKKFGGRSIAVNSGTSSLHLAYELLGLQKGDEVIAPLFTCTATNIPLAQMGLKIRFCDIEKDSLNMCLESAKKLINKKTKAIILVHYGGQSCDLKGFRELSQLYEIPIIQDCAHGIGMEYLDRPIFEWADYTMYSLQAIKSISTGDGGILTFNDSIPDSKVLEAKRRRWFGIDREKKQGGIWENDITELGHKWQMTDISATIGIESLKFFDSIWARRFDNLQTYRGELANIPDIKLLNMSVDGNCKHGSWLATISVKDRLELQKYLYSNGIESNQVHYRNDRYSIFSSFCRRQTFPNMDAIEDNYLVLPSHHLITKKDVKRICRKIRNFYD